MRIVLALLFVIGIGPIGRSASAQPSSLRIVVVEGEDAINILQQKTAVAPVVEVRDRNNQPVAGAVVRFAIRSGRASFNGARTLSVTTNAAGRAVAAGLTPTGSGALQITASAAFQGQTAAAVTIAQTNAMTAAAAGAGASGSGAGGTGGAAAGSGGAAGGGGLSATAIGIVGGAVAGGAIAAKEVLGGPGGRPYSGTYSGQYNVTVTNPGGGGPACTLTQAVGGTLTIRIEESTAPVKGTAEVRGTQAGVSATCSPPPTPGVFSNDEFDAPLAGTADALSFSRQESRTFPLPSTGQLITVTDTYSFSGSLSGDVITGTLTFDNRQVTSTRDGSGSVAIPLTMR